MLDELLIEDEKTAKVLSDPLRQRILRALVEHGAQTSSGLSRLMGLAAAKLHYHLGKLEAVGLVELDHEERIHGISARYLRAVARSFRLEQTFVRQSLSIQSSVLTFAREQFDEALEHLAVVFERLRAGEPRDTMPEVLLLVEHLTLSREEAAQLEVETHELLKKYAALSDVHRGEKGETGSWQVLVSAVPVKRR
jgi:DNA-binding transcriptional ArsR family regulator